MFDLFRKPWFWVVAVLIAVPGLVAGWWLGSPLFRDISVDEQFPRSVGAVIPADMTREQVEQEMASAAERTEEAAEPMTGPMADATRVLFGSFVGADEFHRGAGSAAVYRLADGSHVLRIEELQVTNGPDLHVFVNPQAGSTEGAIDLGTLKGNRGNQNYVIPPEVPIDQIAEVTIYCVRFRVLFATAPLLTPRT